MVIGNVSYSVNKGRFGGVGIEVKLPLGGARVSRYPHLIVTWSYVKMLDNPVHEIFQNVKIILAHASRFIHQKNQVESTIYGKYIYNFNFQRSIYDVIEKT